MADDDLIARYEERQQRTAEMANDLRAVEHDAELVEEDDQLRSMWARVQDDERRCSILCGFTPAQFLELYALVERVLPAPVGRGRRGSTTKQDHLLMLLVYVKHYETYAKLGAAFGVSKPHALRLVRDTAEAVLPVLWGRYVLDVVGDVTEADVYPEFPRVAVLMDVTFQPCWTPAGTYDEKKRYYSGKHKMYGLKTQCIHDLRGRVIHCVTGVPGAVHDLTIAQRSAAVLKQFLEVEDQEQPGHAVAPAAEGGELVVDVVGDGDDLDAELEELGVVEPALPQPLQVMVDSGYQGLQHLVPSVLPFKRPRGGHLTAQQRQHNRRLAHRRVLAENYYGRLKLRHRIMCDKYRGERSEYMLFFKICISLTNYHLALFPLRE